MGYAKTVMSGRLTIREKNNVSNRINQLIQRYVLNTQTCPLGEEDLHALWRAQLPPVGIRFYEALIDVSKTGLVTPVATDYSYAFEIGDGKGALILQLMTDKFDMRTHPMWTLTDRLTVIPREVIGEEKAEELLAWMKNSIHAKAVAVRSAHVLHEVVQLAGTAGQLQRMAPDLLKYCDELSALAAAQQERRSPLPEAWMMVSRLHLRCALDLLGVGYLLGEIDVSNPIATAHDSDVSGVRYSCRPSEYKMPVYTYELSDDPNPMVQGQFVIR
jgi:hypothetical protein